MDINNPQRVIYWYFKNLYSSEEIKFLNEKIQKNLIFHQKDKPAVGVVKTAQVSIFDPSKIKELDRIFKSIYFANRQCFGFNLFSSLSDEYLPLNYNVYDAKAKGEYKYHTDGDYNNPVLDVKLTGILNLSMQSYTGGDFYLNPFGKEMTAPEFSGPGDMIVFPAWFFHKVTPVTQGKRITVSIWGKGPKFI